MIEAGPDFEVPPEKRERLLMVIHPKRAAFLIYYILGIVAFVTSLIFNVVTAGLYVPYNLYSWLIGISALVFAVVLVTWTELRKRRTYYLITTWNVRVRKGLIKKTTTRIFYDEIDRVETESNPEERMVGMGNVKIYPKWQKDKPYLVIDGIGNPDGIRELIVIMMNNTPATPPWDHIDRRAEVIVHK